MWFWNKTNQVFLMSQKLGIYILNWLQFHGNIRATKHGHLVFFKLAKPMQMISGKFGFALTSTSITKY